MKAAVINEYGNADVLKTVDGITKPQISDDQVLVEVYATSVNPFDGMVREGMLSSMVPLNFPATLGGDVAGVVSEVGSNVTHVKPGDAVYGMAGALSSHGAFAEFAPVDGGQIAAKPSKLSDAEAAALPLVGVSALQALAERLNVQPGQKVLIHGGAGGIGGVAVQIAKHLGADVTATASADTADYVKALGADTVLDYKTQKFQDELSEFDAVFDTVGGDTFTESFKVLKPGGSIVTMAGQANPELDEQYGVTSHGQQTQATTARLIKLAELIDAGIVTIHIDKTFPLDEAGQALGYLQTGHPKGKVVIRVRD